MIHEAMEILVSTINDWGYVGIGLLMMMESTVLPVPSELVLVPAGYLVHQGEMNAFWILFASTVGSLLGATFNYFVSWWVGRPFLEKYGKYFFVKPELLQKTDVFFAKYGSLSTFTGRLLPVIRHLISIPAGLTRMNFMLFSLYTSLGAFVWSLVLVVLGYYIGDNQELVSAYLSYIVWGIILLVLLLWGAKVWIFSKRASQ